MTTVVITGAARGLGFRLAEAYLEQGATVFGLYRLDQTAELSRTYGDRFHAIQCDTTDEEQVRHAAEHVARAAGAVDILINNAAVYLEKPFTEANEFDADVARRTFDVNAVGPLLVTKHFLPLVLAGSSKRIVNISSEAGSISQNKRSREYAYCMSKAALNMQSVILQQRVKGDGVKVLAIQPGWMRTEMGGTDADLDPKESASGIVDVIARNSDIDGPMYLDYTGRACEW
jgi:NAD(P)-dependent dehydrogenase (short-subunit alcohol dehydrogenase family)